MFCDGWTYTRRDVGDDRHHGLGGRGVGGLRRGGGARGAGAGRVVGGDDGVGGPLSLPRVSRPPEQFQPRSGQQKRLLGNICKHVSMLIVEQRVYDTRSAGAVRRRKHKVDIAEIYGGMASISLAGIEEDLRALHPVDKSHCMTLETARDLDIMYSRVLGANPTITIFEIMCTVWSQLMHCNFMGWPSRWRREELHSLRKQQMVHVRAMCTAADQLLQHGGHIMIESPLISDLWKIPGALALQRKWNLSFAEGDMCSYNLRGKGGLLMKKPTRWVVSHPCLAHAVSRRCTGDHDHMLAMQSNSKLAQVYTIELARSVCRAARALLQELGDDRCSYDLCRKSHEVQFQWVDRRDGRVWQLAGDETHVYGTFYLDLDRSERAWQSILQGVSSRLLARHTPYMILRGGDPLYQRILCPVPWELLSIQIYRMPKARRLTLTLEKPFHHRACILLHTDGTITAENDAVVVLDRPSNKFKPVAYAIFVYGAAPATAVGEADRTSDEPQGIGRPPGHHDEDEEARPWEPGASDVTFPGVPDSQCPAWVKRVLRRMHCNLGYPPKASFVRQLAHDGASPTVLIGARALRCSVCIRIQLPREPRAVKLKRGRRFNGRLFMDIIYVADVTQHMWQYVSLVDDASVLHCAGRIPDRTPNGILEVVIALWFRTFGPPDEIVTDLEPSVVGGAFTEALARFSVQLRTVPRDAHWELGKGERHGHSLKWIVSRLTDQFGPTTGKDMHMLLAMGTRAKNVLIRRSGASLCQWAFGRNPKLPAGLLSDPDGFDARQEHNMSSDMLHIERVRANAYKLVHDYEIHNTLGIAMLRKGRSGSASPSGERAILARLPVRTGRRLPPTTSSARSAPSSLDRPVASGYDPSAQVARCRALANNSGAQRAASCGALIPTIWNPSGRPSSTW